LINRRDFGLKQNIKTLLVLGFMAGFVVLVNSWFRSESGPGEGDDTLTQRDIEQEKLGTLSSDAEQAAEESLEDLLEERRELDETVWAKEVAAQKHEETIVSTGTKCCCPKTISTLCLHQSPFKVLPWTRRKKRSNLTGASKKQPSQAREKPWIKTVGAVS